MAKSSKLRVMISSRCNDVFPPAPRSGGKTLSEVRRALKKEIEAFNMFGKPIFEVWINEDAPPGAATLDSWERCLAAVKDCDVLLVLSNGNAGWAKAKGDIGICHAEYMTALSIARQKVWLVSLGNVATGSADEHERNERFQAFVAQQTPFRGGEVKTIDELRTRVKEVLRDALVTLAQRGVCDPSGGRFDMGQALDWSRMDFRRRKHEMEVVLRDTMSQRRGTRRVKDSVIVPLGGSDVFAVAHAIPAALSVAAARELVGQPFRRDHEFAGMMPKGTGGPVHVIACHKTATETQATSLLGFPDATVVSTPFGVYVADNVQKVQFAFIVNCRDDANTRHGVQRFFEWLDQTGEAALMATRAQSRAKIVRAIADEMTTA